MLSSGGSFGVEIRSTAAAAGTYGNTCSVDPDGVIVEGTFTKPNEADNFCSANTVTVTPPPPGDIRIVNDVIPDGPQDVAFTATGGLTPATFALDDDADRAASNLQEFIDVPRGTYTVTADPIPGFSLTKIDCADTGSAPSTGDPGTRTATIRLEPSETVTCTFTHVRRPMVTIDQAAAQVDPTTSGPVVFDVVFDEPVTGFAAGDVTLAGTAGATTAVVTGGPTAYTVTVSGMTGDGTIVATVPPGVAADVDDGTNLASTSTDNVVTYDATAPSVTVDQAAAQADPTNSGPVVFDVVFAEPVTGFATGDVTLAGTAGAISAVVSGGPAVYTVTVSGMTGDGTIVATVPPGVAADVVGNTNLASASTDNVVTYDATASLGHGRSGCRPGRSDQQWPDRVRRGVRRTRVRVRQGRRHARWYRRRDERRRHRRPGCLHRDRVRHDW